MRVSNYADILKQSSLKVTIQRVSMLKIVEKQGHISIEKLHRVLKKAHPSISLNTVYLNIEKLKQSGIINKILIDSSKPKYEIKKQEHIHLICSKCSSVTDQRLPHSILDSFELDDGFEAKKVSLNIYGVCSSCR